MGEMRICLEFGRDITQCFNGPKLITRNELDIKGAFATNITFDQRMFYQLPTPLDDGT